MMPQSILAGADVIMSDELRQRLDESSLYVDEAIIEQRKERILPRLELVFSGSSVMHSFECVDTQCMRAPGMVSFDEWHISFIVNDPLILFQAMKCNFVGPAHVVVGNDIVESFELDNDRILSIAVGQAIDGVSVTYVVALV